MHQIVQHLQILWALKPEAYFFCLMPSFAIATAMTAAIGMWYVFKKTGEVLMLVMITTFVTTFVLIFVLTISEAGKYGAIDTITNPKAYIAEVTTTKEGEPILKIKIDPQVTERIEQLLGNSLKVVEKEGEKTVDLSVGEAKRLTSLGLNICCKPGLEEKVTLALSQK